MAEKVEAPTDITQKICELCNERASQYCCIRCKANYCSFDCKSEKHASCHENFRPSNDWTAYNMTLEEIQKKLEDEGAAVVPDLSDESAGSNDSDDEIEISEYGFKCIEKRIRQTARRDKLRRKCCLL